MPKQQTDDKATQITCSFCGAKFSSDNKGKLAFGAFGPKAVICQTCVGDFLGAMASADPEWREKKIAALEGLRGKPNDAT